ncbi:MAG: protein translocase subunit SecD [Erysipelotrichaceae bacterium]
MKKNSRLIIFGLTVLVLLATVIGFYPNIQNGMTLGLDLQGGFEIVYEVSPLKEGADLPEMGAITQSISKRIDVLGVNEPEISIEGDNRIRIQLAGVKDQAEAREIISTTANLTFRDVNDKLLADAEILTEGGASLAYENGFVVVSLKINDTDKFFELTKTVSEMVSGNNIIVTWLDFEEGVDSYKAEVGKDSPKYISAASVNQGINGDAIIKGSFTDEEARQLANLINSGSLPVKMTEIYSNVVSAEFGINAFSVTVFAGLLGILGVAIFMIFVYRLPGIVSALMLVLYVFVTMLIYNSMGGVFTLPGIAALVLGVGMTVDANVITFERIKDELLLGRSLKTAYEEGHHLAWRTIFDSQFTTFIAAFLMYMYGTGAVKGFATMLMVTIFSTLMINVFFVKFLLGLLIKSGKFDDKKPYFGVKDEHVPDLSKGEEKKYFGLFNKIDFVKISKGFIFGSIAIITAGFIFGVVNFAQGNGFLNLGIDFTSGSKLTINSKATIDEQTLISDLNEVGLTGFKVQLSGDKVAYVTTGEILDRTEIDSIGQTMLAKYGLEMNDSVVTPVVGNELIRNALILSLLAWVFIMLFITIRFEFDYAFATILALMHDVFIVFAVFSVLRLEFNIELIAVILAIIGYSVDDSIVIFDRIRENVKAFGSNHISKEAYRKIVNESLQATVQRSLYNTITTLIPIVFLIGLGSQAIFNFNFAMLVGLIAGAYSSIFIAAQFWYWVRVNRKPRVVKAKPKKKSNEPEEMVILGIND